MQETATAWRMSSFLFKIVLQCDTKHALEHSHFSSFRKPSLSSALVRLKTKARVLVVAVLLSSGGHHHSFLCCQEVSCKDELFQSCDVVYCCLQSQMTRRRISAQKCGTTWIRTSCRCCSHRSKRSQILRLLFMTCISVV